MARSRGPSFRSHTIFRQYGHAWERLFSPRFSGLPSLRYGDDRNYPDRDMGYGPCCARGSSFRIAEFVPGWVYQPIRRLMDALRAVNEMVFALIFIVAVGLGPFAGVMALFVHTTGTLAKLFSEAVEAVDPRPIEGIRVCGGGRLTEVIFGVIPQVLPLWISFCLYRFESNVRSASVVGMVGAGGIGTILYEVIRSFEYAQTCAVLIILIVSVSVIDLTSAYLRKLVT